MSFASFLLLGLWLKKTVTVCHQNPTPVLKRIRLGSRSPAWISASGPVCPLCASSSKAFLAASSSGPHRRPAEGREIPSKDPEKWSTSIDKNGPKVVYLIFPLSTGGPSERILNKCCWLNRPSIKHGPKRVSFPNTNINLKRGPFIPMFPSWNAVATNHACLEKDSGQGPPDTCFMKMKSL